MSFINSSDCHVRSDYLGWCEKYPTPQSSFSYFSLHVNQPVLVTLTTASVGESVHMHVLTFALDFIRAPRPDNSSGLQLDLKSPSFWPLGLFGVKQCQHCSQLQVSVQVVHLGVVVHPRYGSVGKEARGSSHVHFPCLLSVSSQNNLLCPGLDRDAYSKGARGEIHEITITQRASYTSMLHTFYSSRDLTVSFHTFLYPVIG